MLLLSIPEPCHENWDKMSPREQGAFCNVCSKVVVDFTQLSDEQVKNYFFANRGLKTCGRFRNEQLVNDTTILTQIFSSNIPVWKKFLAAVVILFGSLVTSCNEQVKGKISTPEIVETKTITTTGITFTDITYTPDTIQFPLPGKMDNTICTTTEGLIEPVIIDEIIECPIIMGELKEMPLPPDTALPLIIKIDPLKEKTPGKKECDELKKDSLIYF